jgi:hypothetical protein
MLATCLLPEKVARQDGWSEAVPLGSNRSKPLLVTLCITRIVEQESLELAVFPQKFYCGDYTMLLDLTKHPDVRYLRSQWKMSCWGRGYEATPLFGFYLTAEDPKVRAVGVS